jgi:predicted HicB family RNase H-like nuclease
MIAHCCLGGDSGERRLHARDRKAGRADRQTSQRPYMTEKRIKTAQVNLRIEPSLKAAAGKAASDDRRSLTSLIEKLSIDY